MEIPPKQTSKTPQIPQTPAVKEAGKNGSLGERKAELDTAKGPRAKNIEGNKESEAKSVLESRGAEVVETTTKGLVEYTDRFKSLTDQYVDLLKGYAETKNSLREIVKGEKMELTSDQKRMLAQLDKKTADCIAKMKQLHTWMEQAVKTCRPDQLEKICNVTNVYVVDTLDRISDEYATLMLRILDEDEELAAQLKDILPAGVEVEVGLKEPVAKVAETPAKTETEAKPLRWYESFVSLFYGPRNNSKNSGTNGGVEL